jgi:agmatinase
MKFLAAESDIEQARVVMQGLPWDGSVSWRAGAVHGPAAVREASDSIETYSPILKADLSDLAIADIGDVALAGLDAAAAMEAIATATETLVRTGAFVLSIGGDHSVSIGTTRGAGRALPNLAHIVFDAHLDMRATYDGTQYSHACGTRHMAGRGTTFALGIRSGSRDEFADAETMLHGFTAEVELPDEWRRAVGDRPVWVSIDLDVLDPSIFPGTGNPEPGGPTYKELRAAVLGLAGLNVAGVDVVEVSPNLDASGVTAVTAAEMSREIILGLSAR